MLVLWWMLFSQLSSFVGEATSASEPEENPCDKFMGRTVKLREYFFGKDVYAKIVRVVLPKGEACKEYRNMQFAVQRDTSRNAKTQPYDIVWGSEAPLIDNPESDIKEVEGKFVKIINTDPFNKMVRIHGSTSRVALTPPLLRMSLGYVKTCDRNRGKYGKCEVQALKEEKISTGKSWKEVYKVKEDPRKKDMDIEDRDLEEWLQRGDFDLTNLTGTVVTGAEAGYFHPNAMVRITDPDTGNDDFDKFVKRSCARIQSPAPGRDKERWLVKYVWPPIFGKSIRRVLD